MHACTKLAACHAPEGDEFGIVAHLLPRPDAVFPHRAFERVLFVFAPVPAYRRRRRRRSTGRLGRRRRRLPGWFPCGWFRRRSFLGRCRRRRRRRRFFTTTTTGTHRRGFLLGRHLVKVEWSRRPRARLCRDRRSDDVRTTTDARRNERNSLARVVVVVEPLIYSDMWVLM